MRKGWGWGRQGGTGGRIILSGNSHSLVAEPHLTESWFPGLHMVFHATELDSCGQGTERHQLSPFSCVEVPCATASAAFSARTQTGTSEVEGSAGTWNCFPVARISTEWNWGWAYLEGLPYQGQHQKRHTAQCCCCLEFMFEVALKIHFFLFLSGNKEVVVFRVCGLPRVYRWGTLPSMVNHSKMMSCFFQTKGRVLRLNRLNCEQNQKAQVYCSLKGGEIRCWKG